MHLTQSNPLAFDAKQPTYRSSEQVWAIGGRGKGEKIV